MFKKSFLISVVAMAICVAFAQMAIADQIQISTPRVAGYYSGGGGEFTAVIVTGLEGVTDNYTASTSNIHPSWGNSFQTFCLERDEYVGPTPPYDVTLNTEAVRGGVNTNSGDPISLGTAYLYRLFANGSLSGYDYTPGAGREASAALLQAAIWALEEESGDVNNYLSNPFIQLVLAKYVTIAAAMEDANGAFSVYVMNITDTDFTHDIYKQDMLVATPIPAAVWLLASGLFGLTAVRRRKLGGLLS